MKTLTFFGNIEVPFDVVKNYRDITVKQILNEPNAEIRRVLLLLFSRHDENYVQVESGLARFVREGGATLVMGPVAEWDDQSASIYKIEVDLGNPLYFIKFIDGTIHDWIMKLEPKEREAKGFTIDGRKIAIAPFPYEEGKFKCMWDAVGWTYGLSEGQYRPKKRT